MASGDLALNIVIGAQIGGTFGATIGAVTTAIQQISRGDVFGALISGTAALGGAMVTAAQKAGDFEQEVKMLQTSAGESANNLKAVSDGILKISTDTGTSADEIAKAMYYVDSANQHGADSLKVMTVAAEGAKTENANLTTVVNALETVMQGYHMPVDNAANAMNGLIATVQNGRVNLQNLSSAMGQLLPTAAALHVPFSQVAGAMDVMTNAGVQSRMAAMELSHFLLALQSPSGVAEKAMMAVGLSAQQVKDELVNKGLPAALQLITEYVGKKFPDGSVAAVDALKNITGGLLGFKVNASLTGAELPLLEQDIKKVKTAMDDASGSVIGWDVVQGEFNFKLAQAQQAFNNMMITLGTQLLPILGQLLGWVTNIIENFTQWESQTHFVENALQTLVNVIQNIYTAIQPVLQFLSGFFSELGTEFDLLIKRASVWGNNFMVGFLNGMIPIINQIIATVEQVAQEIANYLGFHSPTKKGPGSKLNEWGVGMMTGLAQGIVNSIPIVSTAVQQVANALVKVTTTGIGSNIVKGAGLQYIGSSGDLMRASVNPEGTTKQANMSMSTGGSGAGHALTQQMATGIKAGTSAVQSAVNSVAATTDTACKAAASTSKCVSDHLTKTTANGIKAGTPAVSEAAKKVGTSTNPAAEAALKAADAAHKALTKDLAKKITGDVPAVKGAAAMAADGLTKPLENVKPAANSAGQATQQMSKQAVSGVKTAEDAFSAFYIWIQKAFQGIGKWFQQLAQDFAPVSQAAKRFLDSLQTLYQQVVQPLITGIGDLAKGFGIFVQNIAKSIQETGAFNATGKIFALLITTIMDVVSGLVKGLAISLGPAIKAISTVITTQIAPAFGHLLQSMVPMIPAVQALGAILIGGLVVALGVVAGFIVGLITGLANLLAGITQAVGGIIQVISGAIQMINGILDMIVGLITNNQQDILEGQKAFSQGWQDIWTGLGNTIMGILNGLYGFVTGLFSGLANTISSIFSNLYDELVGHSIIPDMISAIQEAFTHFAEWMIGNLKQTVQDFITYWTQVGQEMQRLAILAWSYIQALFQQAWNKYIEPGLAAIKTGVTNWWNAEIAAWKILAQNLWKVVSDIFSGSWTNLAADLAILGKNFQTWFTNEATQWGQWALNLMKMFGQGITSGLTQFIQPAINGVAQAIQNVLGIFSPAKTGPLATSNQWMPNLMNMLASGITAGTSKVTNAANSMGTGVSNSMTNMNSNVANSVSSMKAQLQSVSEDITSMQARVSAAIQQAKAQMQTATSEITGNLTAEKNLISNLIGYLAQQMNQMGQMIQKVEAQANQATAAVNSDVQSSGSAVKAVNIDLNLSDKATAAAWQNQLNAVKAAEQSMKAMGMSTQAQGQALQAATKAGNDAYLSALSSGKSQSDALKADTAAFNASIAQSKSAASDQKSMQSAAQSNASAQASGTSATTSINAAKTSQAGATASWDQSVVAATFSAGAWLQAHLAAVASGASWQSADAAGNADQKATQEASKALIAAHMSSSDMYNALDASQKAYDAAHRAAIDKGQSESSAQQAGMQALQASLKASIAAAKAVDAKTEANFAQLQSVTANSSLQDAISYATQSMTQAGMSKQQQQAAQQSANQAAWQAQVSATAANKSATETQKAVVSAYNSSIAASEASASMQKSQTASASSQTYSLGASGYAQQSTTAAKTSKDGATTSQQYMGTATTSYKTIVQDNKESTNFLQSLKADVAQAQAMAAQVANAAAQAMASRLAMFSPAKEGPLSTADQWIPNMLKMFEQGLVKEAPELKNATKITAKGVKDAFAEAALEAGASLVSLKQKSDDIYAVIKTVGTGGTGGTPSQTITTTDTRTIGELVSSALNSNGSYMTDLTQQYTTTTTIPGTPGTSGSGGGDQYMTIHLDLDGKTIAQVVTKYQAKSIRAQAGIRNI